MTDIQCVFESMAGKGSIYISNFAAAQDIHLLQSKGIKAILSVARSGLLHHSKEDVPYYLYLPAQDHEDYEIYKFFNQTYDFINQSRKHTNVLVHCMAGISRSVTIVIAYLLKKFKCSLGEVIRMLQRKRSKINPNKGFMEQLKKYAQEEGLKCNFNYEEVPYLKDKPEIKGKVDQSKSKEKLNETQYILTNPLAKSHKKKVEESSTFEKTVTTGEDMSQFSKKSQELKRSSPSASSVINGEDNFGSDSKEYTRKSQDFTVPLKKRYSFDLKPPALEKKLSIQEKIIKVREKILQKEKIKKTLSRQNSAEDDKEPQLSKQNQLNSLKLLLQHKKSSNKQISEYLSFCSHQKSTIMGADSFSLQKQYQSLSSKQEPEQFYINMCETEVQMYSKSYKNEPRLYSKLYPKKVLGKAEQLTQY